ncbi:hypothetical protein H0W91_03275 [Patescibacteria group bacterium]|nr:hypothetical protein [Patescibacteria group bacterium]
MKNTDSQFLKQLQFLNKVYDLVAKIIDEIENIGKTKNYNSEIEDLYGSARLVFLKRSLYRFNEIFKFLILKLETESENLFIHYLPNLRCLFDIYSRLIFIIDNTIEKASLIIIAENLKKVANIINSAQNDTESLKKAYNDQVNYYKTMFSSQGINLPQDPLLLSNNFLKTNNIQLPKIVLMLTPVRMRKFSNKTRKVWKTISDNPYLIYRHFSSYAHGDDMNENHGNEILWIASEMQMVGILTLELFDSQILDDKFSTNINLLLTEVNTLAPEWVEYWQNRKLS